jgi:CxxC motif-containing protein (DUF1111 family)
MRIGCDTCHVPQQTTYGGVDFFPYSDFALHSMGNALADGIIQGNAAGDEFRTAPLWGIGQRLFFLHDGRTNDLLHGHPITCQPGFGGKPSRPCAAFAARRLRKSSKV